MTTIANSGFTQSQLDQINGTSSSSSTQANLTSAEEIQNRFLKLLTTQIQAQDPLNPMDNSQMTSQMSQISMVSGLEKLNATLQSMMDSQASSQSMAATNVLGKKVLAAGNDINLQQSSAAGMLKLAGPADKISVDITDSSGNIVRSLSLPAAGSAGMVSYTWDGKDKNGNLLADGSYSVNVTASSSGTAVTATPLQGYLVSAVAFDTGKPQLLLSSGQRVSMSDVQLITE
ncbi:flagellar hook assembly protein FlgD [Vogesella sp. LIG4]|uniref:flagellar hook assembly protein FlgD n=1 Tax=Vogesella sp. LIG4 TaxID=1192162 RepID=UPI00081FE43E|nr:flagellar hook assembly protein FlgD [Vogesella sp. LIG4]SCK30339.1 flagellar basal-body rod modification protein FlgD [Vogesella sp. LIG4]